MTDQETLRALLHDLSSPLSVLLLMEDELPVHAGHAVHKMREIIEHYRQENTLR